MGVMRTQMGMGSLDQEMSCWQGGYPGLQGLAFRVVRFVVFVRQVVKSIAVVVSRSRFGMVCRFWWVVSRFWGVISRRGFSWNSVLGGHSENLF